VALSAPSKMCENLQWGEGKMNHHRKFTETF